VSTLNKKSDLQVKEWLEHTSSFRRDQRDSAGTVNAEGREIVVEDRKGGGSGNADDKEPHWRVLVGSKLEP
jgi:hypothetical protein